MIERRFCHTKQWRGLATHYDKHAIVYRAAVLIHASIAWTRRLSTVKLTVDDEVRPGER